MENIDKTSREYAEKLAFEKYPEYRDERIPVDEVILRINKRNERIEAYLTAIEETNAKGKDEVIKIQLDALEAVYPMLLDTHDVAIKVAEAIRKAKEVTNGK